MTRSKRILIGLGVGLLLTLGVAGAALAQGTTNQAQNGTGTPTCVQVGLGAGTGRMGLALGRNADWHSVTLVSVAADKLGLTVQQIVAETSQGKTLEQVIVAHNGDPQAIVDAFISARKAILDQLVASGQLTQAQEDTMLAQMREQATAQLATSLNCSGNCPGQPGANCNGAGSAQQGGQNRGPWRTAPQA